jgi:hypothetical protein
MADQAAQSCPQRDATSELAGDRLAGPARAAAEAHLEQCETCRLLYRRLTDGRFPRFRGYTIVSELGRGGFGVVYKAFHHGKARTEALKVLFSTTPVREAYFQNEVHLVARLRHPNIATLYEARLHSPPLYYAMEFVAGQQLDEYIRSQRVSLEERIRIVRTVAAAIDYAHHEGVIHRDLKPQNIIIDAEGQPRIVDFGIAKRLGLTREEDPAHAGATPREGPLGTYGYIAPEQLNGDPVDGRADVYGLGVLLFHVITGQPARFATQLEHLTQILREREVNRAADLAAIIACCVNPDPEQRYATCRALVEDLDQYLAGREIRARRDAPPGYRAARIAALVVRNHPRPIQVMVAVLSAALLTVTLWKAGAQWATPGASVDESALVALTPSTLEAMRQGVFADVPGLSAEDRKSWRLLYGRLMAGLAIARPRVVVWDCFFPDCRPEYDEEFIRGVQALGAPVIVGVSRLDADGEPVLCPALRAAIHGWGILHSGRLDRFENEVEVPLAAQREFGDPVPSLATAVFTAARFPDSEAVLRIRPDRVDIAYRKRAAAPGERRWRAERDSLPVFSVTEAGVGMHRFEAGTRIVHGRFPLDRLRNHAERAIPVERVLLAETAERRQWFADRVVLVGQMLPGIDEYPLRSGERVFGCLVQASVIDALLSQSHLVRLPPAAIVLRACLWCALAASLAGLVRARPTWSRRIIATAAATTCVVGLVLAVFVAVRVTDRAIVEVAIAACAGLLTIAPVLLINVLHERQLHLTPTASWWSEGAGSSTTVPAATPRSSVP